MIRWSELRHELRLVVPSYKGLQRLGTKSAWSRLFSLFKELTNLKTGLIVLGDARFNVDKELKQLTAQKDVIMEEVT